MRALSKSLIICRYSSIGKSRRLIIVRCGFKSQCRHHKTLTAKFLDGFNSLHERQKLLVMVKVSCLISGCTPAAIISRSRGRGTPPVLGTGHYCSFERCLRDHYVRFAHSPPFFSFWEEGAISFPSSRFIKFDF